MMSFFKPRSKNMEIYIAHQVEDPSWFLLKLASASTPTLCIHLSNGELTLHSNAQEPIPLNIYQFSRLFERIGKGWCRLAKPQESYLIQEIIASHLNTAQPSPRERSYSI